MQTALNKAEEALAAAEAGVAAAKEKETQLVQQVKQISRTHQAFRVMSCKAHRTRTERLIESEGKLRDAARRIGTLRSLNFVFKQGRNRLSQQLKGIENNVAEEWTTLRSENSRLAAQLQASQSENVELVSVRESQGQQNQQSQTHRRRFLSSSLFSSEYWTSKRRLPSGADFNMSAPTTRSYAPQVVLSPRPDQVCDSNN